MSKHHPIRAYRLSRQPPLRLGELAKRLGTSKGNLSKIENRKLRISAALLQRICAKTGLPAVVLRPDLAVLFSATGKKRKRRQ